MNKIFLLKMLICFLTFLIFLALSGVIYGLVFYDKTPKLLTKKELRQEIKQAPQQEIKQAFEQEAELGLLKDEKIEEVFACGDLICLYLKTPFDEGRVFVVSPKNLNKRSVLNIKK